MKGKGPPGPPGLPGKPAGPPKKRPPPPAGKLRGPAWNKLPPAKITEATVWSKLGNEDITGVDLKAMEEYVILCIVLFGVLVLTATTP